ncbi:alpha/beta hydrolase fold domain-containing protein [Streptomyces sp. NPDC005811]|uniref:alpha/beta hydrolase fold domain-containing protein n=1 Tax=Streptomyces sp. NPDC005811 TaxID=3154565 RepID=UPI0033C2B80D
MSTSADPRANAPLPGRLGDPTMGPGKDPRTNAALRAALMELEMGEPIPFQEADIPTDPDAVEAAMAAAEEVSEGWYASMMLDLPGDDALRVTSTSHSVKAPDGHEVALEVYRPDDADGPLPCVLYFHGGAMTFMRTRNRVYDQWCTDLAAQGAVVVQVDFRNAWTPSGMNPFPAGLSDCAAALAWAHEHRATLGIGSIVVQGESGGGNLALATALKAKRDNLLHTLDGVYATMPYISGVYTWDEERKLRELPSLVENDGYLMATAEMDMYVKVYDPDRRHAEDPLAWPYHATEEDVTGLPPHVVTVNELDPLRDEGIAYQRLLAAADVPVSGRVNLGLLHGSELEFRQILAPFYRATVRDIVSFAADLVPDKPQSV